MFSDETSICVEGRGSSFVRRRTGSKLRPCHFSQRQKFPIKVMFWGCFSAAGLGPIYPCVQTVNTAVYISILEHQLVPVTQTWFANSNEWTFVQDNAPCHVSKATKQWFSDNGIRIMQWPANSPDLNPIENLWSVLKQKLLRTGSLSKQNLEANVKKIWIEDEGLKTLCVKLVESMPKRVETLLKNRGDAIEY